jgi:hypothetical protein
MTATVAGIHLGLDTHANRPAGNTVPDGSIYSCSTHNLVYKSNYAGNSWATWATLGSTGAPTFVGARVYNNANIALNNGSDTLLTFNSERYDTDAFHDTGSNTGRLTVPSGKDGKYLITGALDITSSPGDGSYAFIRLGGATLIAVHEIVNSAANTYTTLSTVYSLAATNYVELGVQVQAGSKNAISAGNFSPEFSISLLGV